MTVSPSVSGYVWITILSCLWECRSCCSQEKHLGDCCNRSRLAAKRPVFSDFTQDVELCHTFNQTSQHRASNLLTVVASCWTWSSRPSEHLGGLYLPPSPGASPLGPRARPVEWLRRSSPHRPEEAVGLPAGTREAHLGKRENMTGTSPFIACSYILLARERTCPFSITRFWCFTWCCAISF